MSKSDEVAIKVTNVNKTFKLPHEKHSSIKGLFINIFNRKRTYEKQKVLKDISFEIKKGEFFGIVGRNGSGKSTLLKLLAGIYSPDSGHIQVNGKLTPFIELGVGFNPELTGRENVFLNGALLGFNRKEMLAMYEEIVEFAELEKFMDQKLKNYSSGMQVRLAFSIAIRAKSDILLIDEVLAVGDTAFQRKCYETFIQLKKEGRTIILVTHDMGAIERFCEKAMVINQGKIIDVYSPSDAASYYDQLNANYVDNDIKDSSVSARRWGNKEVIVEKVSFLQDGKKLKKPDFRTGSNFEIKINLKYNTPQKVVVGLAFEDSFGVNISGPNSTLEKPTGATVISYKIPKLPLLPGQYKLTVAIYDADVAQELDHLDKYFVFQVTSDRHDIYGKVSFFGEWSHEG